MCNVLSSMLPPRLAKALLAVLLCLSTTQATEFVLTTAAEAPYHRPDQTGLMNQLVAEAFRRVGIEIRVVQMPGERALQTSNAGNVDGDAFRVMGLQDHYNNLIPTTESIFDMNFSAFTLSPMSTENSWDDISKLRIGIVRGYKILEFQSQGMNVTQVNDQLSMFNMLLVGRIDVAVTSKQIGLDALRRNGITGLVLNEPPILVMPLFIYLHKKHEALVPLLTQAVKDMKADGTHQRIIDNF
jgi:polar amino acid transport system substrate-binding protein